MKKLFALAFSALMVLGVASCGSKAPADPDHTFHAVGGWGVWEATEENKMEAVTVDDVKALDAALGETLASKNVKYVYKANISIGADVVWDKNPKAKVNGEVKEFNGKYTVKCIIAGYDKEEQTYTNDHWLPNPADTDPGHVEALTSNVFIPTYQKEPDPDGFSWADNPVITDGGSSYTFIVAQYNAVSSETVVGYGFGAIKNA